MSNKPVVKNAVILAAGKSSRFRKSGVLTPKVLMKLGGLGLLERAILTLNKAGVENFRIPVGAYRDQVVPAMKAKKRLKDINIEYVVAEDYEKGNGVSFGVGAAGFDEPFLLTMSDHIFAPSTVNEFIRRTAEAPHLPALACDPELDDVFDMDDATKVLSDGEFIGNIGKEIDHYDLVDTGLFYFPKNYGPRIGEQAKNGAYSVSNIIQTFKEESGVRAVALDHPKWQDIDTPDMREEAEKRLSEQITRPDLDWLSRKMNGLFTSRISFLFANLGIHPTLITTVAFVMTLVGAWFASTGIYLQMALGAFIFQIASILDSSNGELTRLTLRSSKFTRWYDQFASNTRYVIFFGALGVSAWLTSGSQVYLFGLFLLTGAATYLLFQLSKHARQPDEVALSELMPDSKKPEYDFSLFGSSYNFWRELNKQDLLAFMTFFCCIFFIYQTMFWLALLGTTATAVMVSRSKMASKMQRDGASSTILENVNPIYFYLLGIAILVGLIFSLDFNVVMESLSKIGNQLFLIFSVAILWILANTMCIYIILKGKVSFPDLMYNQLTGDAYNALIPLAGLAGEPYKIKHLTQWLDWNTATRSIIVDRMIHISAALAFTAICLGLTLFLFDIKTAFFIPLAVAAVSFGVISLLVMRFALTAVPSRVAGFLLKKLKIVEAYKDDPIEAGTFFKAFFFKMLGRTFNLIEIYLIFMALSIVPSFFDLTAVAGFITTSASLFFIIPQGLGVNELGISSALEIVGYTAALGITFGLIRRARMIFWALFGVALHFAFSMVKRLKWSQV